MDKDENANYAGEFQSRVLKYTKQYWAELAQK